MPDGTEQAVEHGFHAFFRHYYTWRDVLRRADPGLAFLRPVGGYPVISRQWPDEDITGLPAAPPLNLLTLIARSPSLRLARAARREHRAGRRAARLRPAPHHSAVRRHVGRRVPRRAGVHRPRQGHAVRGVRPLVLLQPVGDVRRRAGGDVPLLLPRQPGGHRVRRAGRRLPRLHLVTAPGAPRAARGNRAASARRPAGCSRPATSGWRVELDGGHLESPTCRARARPRRPAHADRLGRAARRGGPPAVRSGRPARGGTGLRRHEAVAGP